MGSTRDLIDAIRNIVASDSLMSFACTVTDINTTNYTCNCSPVDGSADFINVLLNADKKTGFVLIPKNNSIVVITMTSNVNAFVSMVSEVDTILMKGDNYGGLIKINELKTQLNTLQTEINTLKTLVGTAITVYSGALDGGVSAATFNAAILPQINLTTLENTNIKHGSS